MSNLFKAWPRAMCLSEKIISRLCFFEKEHVNPAYEVNSVNFIWKNYLWTSDKFRKAHVEIVDAIETKKIWVMHVCIYPHGNSSDPVFGFDIVCGPNKISGAFHDFSFMGESILYEWFQVRMLDFKWSKPRNLPEWARNIFSPQMVAVGNIKSHEEFDLLEQVVLDNLDHYLDNCGKRVVGADYVYRQNKYCKNQKLNPHLPALMETLGVDKLFFRKFMDEVLFPENHES